MEDIVSLKLLLFIDCDFDTMMERILERASGSGKKRLDDDEKVIKKRFVVYQEETTEIIKFFAERKEIMKVSRLPRRFNVFKINGMQTTKEVFNDIVKGFSERGILPIPETE